MNNLEKYFEPFRLNTIGFNQTFLSPYGHKQIVYADWIASGRLYKPIEDKISQQFGPFVGNTHSEESITGTTMTIAYHHSHDLIKKHVNAGKDDVIITAGAGMTGMVNKFQRILGLKVAEQLKAFLKLPETFRPIVFITHMEHHSNQTSWLETIADVIVIKPTDEGLVDLNDLEVQLKKYTNRKLKIGSFTACSNVTGIHTPYHEMAKIMHEHDGFCFVDFACSAPYEKIDMHPDDPMKKLDAIFFSPHKFLGGPGSSGVLIFDSNLYKNRVPDDPGGGTVDWTNPWGEHKFVNNIEAREDGGTPAFLQSIRASLAIKLKEEMGVENILLRERQLLKKAFEGLRKIPGLHILADNIDDRLGAISFYVDGIHYNLIVKLLNDRFGVQVRGGCSCAGTYGHYLLHVTPQMSKQITEKIDHGDLSEKPGWVRMSIHPIMTDAEIDLILDAIEKIARNISEWKEDYIYDIHKNEYYHKNGYSREGIYKIFDLHKN
ncbi:MAG: aminotransferase class V-fold PLP-dependent enzyme [Ignavibacteriaceae bacterium]|nr:aminotransferase class V-fold PLP-dependent enzyme [Ignavibacteriaceae bacterium]